MQHIISQFLQHLQRSHRLQHLQHLQHLQQVEGEAEAEAEALQHLHLQQVEGEVEAEVEAEAKPLETLAWGELRLRSLSELGRVLPMCLEVHGSGNGSTYSRVYR